MSYGDEIAGSACDAAESGERSKRKQILHGAREVFLAQGFDGASMGEIAQGSGVSKGTLYVYFDSKDKLFEALTHRGEKDAGRGPVQARSRESRRARRSDELGASLPEGMAQPEHVSSSGW